MHAYTTSTRETLINDQGFINLESPVSLVNLFLIYHGSGKGMNVNPYNPKGYYSTKNVPSNIISTLDLELNKRKALEGDY